MARRGTVVTYKGSTTMAIGTAYLAINRDMSCASCELLDRFPTEWIGILAISVNDALSASGNHFLKFGGGSAKSGRKKHRAKGANLLGFTQIPGLNTVGNLLT